MITTLYSEVTLCLPQSTNKRHLFCITSLPPLLLSESISVLVQTIIFSISVVKDWNLISIEGPWHVHATQNTFDEGEQLEQLMRLRRERIHQVRLGDEHPHLELEFESGSLLFINGYQEHFECWQAGDARPLGGDAYLLVAMPQGELAIFADGDDE